MKVFKEFLNFEGISSTTARIKSSLLDVQIN